MEEPPAPREILIDRAHGRSPNAVGGKLSLPPGLLIRALGGNDCCVGLVLHHDPELCSDIGLSAGGDVLDGSEGVAAGEQAVTPMGILPARLVFQRDVKRINLRVRSVVPPLVGDELPPTAGQIVEPPGIGLIR